jgi:hypothetical protein
MRVNTIASLESLLALADQEEESLAHHAPKLDAVSGEELERIARLAYRISQVEGERTRRVLPGGTIVKPWSAFTPRERVEAAATVNRVLQALVLLGWVEAP